MYEVTEKMYEIAIGDGMLVEKNFRQALQNQQNRSKEGKL